MKFNFPLTSGAVGTPNASVHSQHQQTMVIFILLTLTLVVYLPPSYQGYCPYSGGPF